MNPLGPGWALRILIITQMLLLVPGIGMTATIFLSWFGVPLVCLCVVTTIGVFEARENGAPRLPQWVIGCFVVEAVGFGLFAVGFGLLLQRNGWSMPVAMAAVLLVFVMHSSALLAVVHHRRQLRSRRMGPARI